MDNLTLTLDDFARSMESLRRDFPELIAQADLISACSTKGLAYVRLLNLVNKLAMCGAFDGVEELKRKDVNRG